RLPCFDAPERVYFSPNSLAPKHKNSESPMSNRMLFPALAASLLILLPPVPHAAAQSKHQPAPAELEDFHLRPFNARSIGPAVMGGRLSTIAYDPVDPFTFYVGLGTGGVMKTADNGVTFSGIFDNESV